MNISMRKIVPILLALSLLLYVISYKYQHTFSERRWTEHPEKREQIVKDFLSRYDLIGMQEDDVIDLLGNDDLDVTEHVSFKLGRQKFDPANTFFYRIGTDFMDDIWLIIVIEDGVVSDYLFGVS